MILNFAAIFLFVNYLYTTLYPFRFKNHYARDLTVTVNVASPLFYFFLKYFFAHHIICIVNSNFAVYFRIYISVAVQGVPLQKVGL